MFPHHCAVQFVMGWDFIILKFTTWLLLDNMFGSFASLSTESVFVNCPGWHTAQFLHLIPLDLAKSHVICKNNNNNTNSFCATTRNQTKSTISLDIFSFLFVALTKFLHFVLVDQLCDSCTENQPHTNFWQ